MLPQGVVHMIEIFRFGVYVVKEYPESIYMCYAAHTLCPHTPQPNAATRDVRTRRSPGFHVNDSDTGGSAVD